MPFYEQSGGGLSSSGATVGRVPKFASASQLVNALLSDDGTNVTVVSGKLILPTTLPAIVFSGATSTGFYKSGTADLGVQVGGSSVALFVGSAFQINGAGQPASAPAISFIGDTDTGIFTPGANVLALSANGLETVRIGSNLGGRSAKWACGHVFSNSSLTGNTTLTELNHILFCATAGGAFTITLPDITTVSQGHEFLIFKTDASANAVTIARSSTDTINGATSKNLATQWAGLSIYAADVAGKVWIAQTLAAA